MVNQELLDYIKGQVSLGVSKDAIRSALLGAGWQQTDIEGAFGSAFPDSAAQVEPVQQVTDVQPNMASTIAQPETRSQPKTISADFFQPHSADVFSPSVSSSTVFKADLKKEQPIIQVSQPHPLKMIIAVSALGLSTLVLGGLYGMAYVKTGDLQSKLDALTQDNSSANSQLAAVRRGTDEGNQQIDKLKSTLNDLNMQFDFLVPGTTSVNFTLSGRLGTSTFGYWLKTSKGIALNLKNAKDPKIDSYIKPFVGSDVSVSGTHIQGSKDVMITGVNGTDVLNMPTPNASTSAASVSTTPAVAPKKSITPID